MAGFWLYLIFVISWFLHLTARVPSLGAVRFDLLLVIATTALSFGNMDSRAESEQRSKISWALVALTLYCVITIPLVQWPGSVVKFGFEAYVKAVVFYFFTVHFVTTERRLRWLLLVFVLCQSFRILEPVYLHVTTGYWGSFASMANWEYMNRLAGAPYDVINPNGLAFVILTVLCFVHYLWTGNWLGRIAYLVVVPISLYALVLTGSRSGMVGLAVVFVSVWLKSRRKLLLALVAVIAIPLAAPRMSGDLVDRYVSIVDSSAKNAGTVTSRIDFLKKSFDVALRAPLFGHGLGGSREALANFGGIDRPAHNLYAEVALELGFLGLGIFLFFLWTVARELWMHQKQWRSAARAPTIVRTGDALFVFMVMNLVFSLASYGLTSYEWYLLAGLTQVLTRLTACAGETSTEVGVPAAIHASQSECRARRRGRSSARLGHVL